MIFVFIALGLLPSFAWLIFFLGEDQHPEPKKMIALVFLYGALITIPAIILQLIFRDVIFSSLQINEYSLFAFLFFAAIEEILKFMVAYWAIHKSKYFDEPVDAMIYILTAALGFALVENVAVAASTGNLSQAIAAVILRFVGATLLHALSSLIIGYYWARSILHKGKHRLSFFIAQGFALATILHGIFNYLIMSTKDILVYPTIFLILIALYVFWDFERIKSTNSESVRINE